MSCGYKGAACACFRTALLLVAISCVQRSCAVAVEPTDAAPVIRSKSYDHTRQLLVNTDPGPNTPPKTVPFDNSLNIGGPDVPSNDPRVAKKGAGCDAPNQVHLTFWTATSILVSWVTCDAATGPTVSRPRPTPGTTSLSYWRAEWECDGFGNYPYPARALSGDTAVPNAEWTDAEIAKYKKKHYKDKGDKHSEHKHSEDKYSEHKHSEDKYSEHKYHGPDYTDGPSHGPDTAYNPGDEPEHHVPCGKPIHVKGVTTSYFYDYSVLSASNNYASGIIHHVLIKDLQPGGTYFYKVSGERTSEVYEFKVPAQTFPLKLGVTADPGLTFNTTFVLDRLMAEQPDLVAVIGDFCYADTWKSETDRLTNADFALYPNGLTYQPKWDTWGNLFEPLLARVPMLHTNGNHEIEGEVDANKQPTGVRMRSYNARYPVPQTPERRTNGPTSFPSATNSNKWENLYYAVEVLGVFKAIHITSFSFQQPMNAAEEQYKWLQAELAKTDRSRTPWVMVNWHSPWYNTYATHFKENEAMCQAYEGLLLQYKVDIEFHGHVHAYERKHPIANNQVNTCGPVSITIGDGGNIEGTYKDFIDTVYNARSYCNPLSANFGRTWNSYQPQPFIMKETRWCGTTPTPCFCYTQQVDWSAYREPSFGYGTLTFESETQATWTWHKNQQSRFELGDQVKIFRGGANSPACGAVDCQCITA